MEFADEGGEGPTPYEVLLLAAMNGQSTRFSRQDSVEETWRVMQPLLDAAPPVEIYQPGSWGPEGGGRDGRRVRRLADALAVGLRGRLRGSRGLGGAAAASGRRQTEAARASGASLGEVPGPERVVGGESPSSVRLERDVRGVGLAVAPGDALRGRGGLEWRRGRGRSSPTPTSGTRRPAVPPLSSIAWTPSQAANATGPRLVQVLPTSATAALRPIIAMIPLSL